MLPSLSSNTRREWEPCQTIATAERPTSREVQLRVSSLRWACSENQAARVRFQIDSQSPHDPCTLLPTLVPRCRHVFLSSVCSRFKISWTAVCKGRAPPLSCQCTCTCLHKTDLTLLRGAVEVGDSTISFLQVREVVSCVLFVRSASALVCIRRPERQKQKSKQPSQRKCPVNQKSSVVSVTAISVVPLFALRRSTLSLSCTLGRVFSPLSFFPSVSFSPLPFLVLQQLEVETNSLSNGAPVCQPALRSVDAP